MSIKKHVVMDSSHIPAPDSELFYVTIKSICNNRFLKRSQKRKLSIANIVKACIE
jgi:hypothetical protein